jgi:hypothetical protein
VTHLCCVVEPVAGSASDALAGDEAALDGVCDDALHASRV